MGGLEIVAPALLLALLCGAALGRYAWPAARTDTIAALAAARGEAVRLGEECRAARAKIEALEGERLAAVAETARLNARHGALTEKLAEQAGERAALQTRLTSEFENIANRILKANAAELSESSQRAVAAVIDPLRERIQAFQHKVETTYESESREVLTLKEQIRHLVETSQAVGSQADGLAKALRGDSQLRGRWGELVLERILEAAGLAEGREYILQGRGLALRNDAGGLQRPDVIVKLPEERTMVIDSKLTLTGYERLVEAGDDGAREATGSQFIRDVKGHIDDLAGKRYQENDKLQAHDCVLMFVPIEGALAAALTRDPELFSYAWTRRVVLVGPSTLLMTLQTVASIWRSERQGQNAVEIARLAGEMCDKVNHSLEDLVAVGDRLSAASEAHNQALKRLSSGRGNVLSTGERLRGMGVKTRRAAPALLVDGLTLAAEAPLEEADASR